MNCVWIDANGVVYKNFSEIDDKYLLNIALYLARGKGNKAILTNNAVVVKGVYDECRRRRIFNKDYIDLLQEHAYKHWFTSEHGISDEEVNRRFERLIDTLKQQEKERFWNEALDWEDR